MAKRNTLRISQHHFSLTIVTYMKKDRQEKMRKLIFLLTYPSKTCILSENNLRLLGIQ